MQIVLYIGDEKSKIKDSIENSFLSYSYMVKDVKEIDCKILIESENIDDNLLATLCKIDNFDKFLSKLQSKLSSLENKKREDYFRKLSYLLRLRPKLYEKLQQKTQKELKMPFTLDKRIDPLYKEGIGLGLFQGVLQVIELNLELKFKEPGKLLFPIIKKIDNMDKLMQIQKSIVKATNIEEVIREIKG